MNIEQARFNMIEQQIRTWEVLDQQVLDLLARIPREDFVPANFRNLAFSDMNTPLTQNQVMMSPKVEARTLQALAIAPEDSVLEVGTGSSYMTALLASLAKHVYSVEIIPELKPEAEKKLAAHNIHNVTIEEGDASREWDRHGPYDVIVITGSLPLMPDIFQQSLRINGRLFAIVGDPPVMNALLITRVGEADYSTEYLFETELPALINAPEPERFVL